MINPIAFALGPIKVHWYGIFYGIGLIISFLLMRWLAARRKLPITQDQIIDFLFWIFIFGVIIGGRLGYVLFYNFPYYLSHPIDIMAIWNGGMSFHGGLIGAVITGYLFCKKKRIDPLYMADLVVIPAAAALALGRIGNFINRELIGRVITDPKWNFLGIDYGDGLLRYPSQLFASFKDVLIFFVLLFLFSDHPPSPLLRKEGVERERHRKKGVIFSMFLILYGAFRFIVEFWREPDPQIGLILNYFTLGQIFSLLLVIIGSVLLWLIHKRTIRA